MCCIDITFPEAVICGRYVTGDHMQYNIKDIEILKCGPLLPSLTVAHRD